MPQTVINRRKFLQSTAIAAAGAAAFNTLVIDPGGAWAMATRTLGVHEANTLLVMARHLYPHDFLGDQYYAKAVEALDGQVADDSGAERTVKDGVATLDRAMGLPFLDLSEGNQLKVVTGIEGSPFFELVRGTTLNSLYGNPLVYRHFGFEGSSVEFGGYIERGFDDIGWLPKA